MGDKNIIWLQKQRRNPISRFTVDQYWGCLNVTGAGSWHVISKVNLLECNKLLC